MVGVSLSSLFEWFHPKSFPSLFPQISDIKSLVPDFFHEKGAAPVLR